MKEQAKELRRAQIWDCIERYVMAHGCGPSYDDICSQTGVSIHVVRDDLAALRARGCVRMFPGKPRSLRVVGRYRLPEQH